MPFTHLSGGELDTLAALLERDVVLSNIRVVVGTQLWVRVPRLKVQAVWDDKDISEIHRYPFPFPVGRRSGPNRVRFATDVGHRRERAADWVVECGQEAARCVASRHADRTVAARVHNHVVDCVRRVRVALQRPRRGLVDLFGAHQWILALGHGRPTAATHEMHGNDREHHQAEEGKECHSHDGLP